MAVGALLLARLFLRLRGELLLAMGGWLAVFASVQQLLPEPVSVRLALLVQEPAACLVPGSHATAAPGLDTRCPAVRIVLHKPALCLVLARSGCSGPPVGKIGCRSAPPSPR